MVAPVSYPPLPHHAPPLPRPTMPQVVYVPRPLRPDQSTAFAIKWIIQVRVERVASHAGQ